MCSDAPRFGVLTPRQKSVHAAAFGCLWMGWTRTQWYEARQWWWATGHRETIIPQVKRRPGFSDHSARGIAGLSFSQCLRLRRAWDLAGGPRTGPGGFLNA